MALGASIHPITLATCFTLGLMFGIMIAKRPDRRARRKRLWFDYAMAALDHAADMAATSSLQDRFTLLRIAEGIHHADGVASVQQIHDLIKALPGMTPRLQAVMMVHLHLAMASRGVDLRRLQPPDRIPS